ncbi:hypothetical protein FPL14_10095 [Cohnella cholangitidis]|uniref:Endoglucanase n=2 Tax=Cohnella cholangitidis TaxID=2598458 RepID=A0A7G5BX22_9BACL|nr:hypothetical protein FPL14_10095 [Cohnella cholangitidis]
MKIPLKDVMQVSQGIYPSSVDALSIKNDGMNPLTVWFNDIKVTSPDKEREYHPIKVNQAGYPIHVEKQALVTGFEDVLMVDENTSFNVINAENHSTAFTGTLVLKKNYDAVDSGERIFTADFTSLQVPGTYYIAVQGLQNSPKFTIGNANAIYEPFLVDVARYFYYQRTGINITSPYTQNYQRTDFTPDTAVPLMSNPSIIKDVSKGWYDAGDKGKYVNAGAKALSDLFWAYEIMPEKFTDNQFNIPESGNGIPDILDEARWELEWMLKMQDAASGGFYARVTFQDDDNLVDREVIDADTVSPRTNIKTTADTATAAAVLAHAYLIYQTIDPAFAQSCLDAAIDAWGYLEAHPELIGTPNTGRWPYDVTDDASNRLWAAGSLYRTTGDAKYNNYFVANYTKMGKFFEDANEFASSWGDTFNTGFFSYLKAANKNPAVVSWYTTKYEQWFNDKVNRYNESAWNSIVRNGHYIWGITMQFADVPMEMIIGTKLLGTYANNLEIINDITYSQLDWILGANPVGISFVSGYGDNSVKYPFSVMFRTDGLQGVPKGYLVGGPNRFSNDVNTGNQISRFAAKNYTDNFQEWTTNEHTVYWNSGLVFVAAFATGSGNANNNSTISPNTAAFDKNTAMQADVPVTLTLNGNTFSGIKNGTVSLAAGTDYTVFGNAITLKKSYLAQQPVGTTNLTFLFSAGASASLAIAVSDSTSNDTVAPSAPANLSSTGRTSQTVSLQWGASTDNIGVTEYMIYNGATQAGSTSGTVFTVTGLTAATSYTFTVKARDGAGNVSAASNAITVATDSANGGTSLAVQYRAADTNAADNQIKPHFNIKNNDTSAVDLSTLKLRYYFSRDGSASVNTWIDWAQIGGENVQRTVTDTYVELSFSSGAGSIAAGGQTGDIQLRMSKSDWSNFNESNDYSFDPTKTAYANWDHVTLFQNGTLVWGIEP